MPLSCLYKYSLLLLCTAVIAIPGYAQNTLIMGKMEDVNLVREIEILVNEKFIDGKSKTYASKILDNNTFAFAVDIRVPQVVSLVYSRNYADIYLEPNDTLYIEANANSFQYSLTFKGRSGKNNNYYKKYRAAHPIEKNEFAYSNYKYGSFWYRNAPKIDQKMKTSNRDAFVKWMRFDKEHRQQDFNAFDQNQAGDFTDTFRAFIAAELEYEWAYHMLTYGNIFSKKHKLEPDYYEYLYDTPLQNNQIGSYYYRLYAEAYINHLYIWQENPIDSIYAGQYELANSQLDELAKAYFQSRLITKAFRKKSAVEQIIPKYKAFLEENPYMEFDEKVVTAFQKTMKYAVGSPAPPFTLKDTTGLEVNLSDFIGKPIYINFWANWCRPCMKKMKEMRTFQKEMEAKGVVFLNISFDRKSDIWQKSILKNNFGGVHVIAAGNIDSDVAKDYNIRALPQYFLVDKNGLFAEKPAKQDLEELRYALGKIMQ